MENTEWLPLIEYSNKYSISISTLRRRIKAQKIEFKKVDGKYLIADSKDQGLDIYKKDQSNDYHEVDLAVEMATLESASELPLVSKDSEEYLLNEVKSAFRLVLQEKEEHIYLLKEENTHLSKLVSLLENQNDLLKKELKKSRGSNSTTLSNAGVIDRLLNR